MQTELKIIMPLAQLKAILTTALADKIKDIDYNKVTINLPEKPDLAIIIFKQEQLPDA